VRFARAFFDGWRGFGELLAELLEGWLGDCEPGRCGVKR